MPKGPIAVSGEDAPPPPTGLQLVQHGKKVSLSWDSNNIESLSKYYIYRGILPHVLILLDSVDASSYNYIDNDIREGTHYYYRIRVINESKKLSGFSEAAAITTSDHKVKLGGTELLGGFYSYPNPLEHETVMHLNCQGVHI